MEEELVDWLSVDGLDDACDVSVPILLTRFDLNIFDMIIIHS